MKRALLFGLASAVIFASTAQASLLWRVIGHASSSGAFAATAANGTAKHPHQLAVRIKGHGVSGFAAVGCSKGIASIGSKSTHYSGVGLHLLKLPFRRPSSCSVTASVGGSGRISIKILAR
jgi:hypothetical protein